MTPSSSKQMEVTVGFACGKNGSGIAYARARGRDGEEALRVPFTCSPRPALQGRDVAYAALDATAATLLGRGVQQAKFVVPDRELVADLDGRRSGPRAAGDPLRDPAVPPQSIPRCARLLGCRRRAVARSRDARPRGGIARHRSLNRDGSGACAESSFRSTRWHSHVSCSGRSSSPIAPRGEPSSGSSRRRRTAPATPPRTLFVVRRRAIDRCSCAEDTRMCI